MLKEGIENFKIEVERKEQERDAYIDEIMQKTNMPGFFLESNDQLFIFISILHQERFSEIKLSIDLETKEYKIVGKEFKIRQFLADSIGSCYRHKEGQVFKFSNEYIQEKINKDLLFKNKILHFSYLLDIKAQIDTMINWISKNTTVEDITTLTYHNNLIDKYFKKKDE